MVFVEEKLTVKAKYAKVMKHGDGNELSSH